MWVGKAVAGFIFRFIALRDFGPFKLELTTGNRILHDIYVDWIVSNFPSDIKITYESNKNKYKI